MNNNMNFGLPSNGQVCEMGLHHGTGDWTPAERAAYMARMRRDMPNYLTPERLAYLESWEKSYGPMKWEMAKIGKNSGEFDKSRKGADLYGPVPSQGRNYKIGNNSSSRMISSEWS